jgi:hypothetical protein
MRNNDILGRILGLLIIIAGVMILFFVFQHALALFTSDDLGLKMPEGKKEAANALGALGVSALQLFARIALLFVMSIVGSIVASKGIQLMFASRCAEPPKKPEA